MEQVLTWLADHPVIVLFLALGIGVGLGKIPIAGVRLGPAMVLFTTIALTALGVSVGVVIEIPTVIGDFSLALFAYTIGVLAGPNFFASLRRSWPTILVVVLILASAGVLARLVGVAFDLSPDMIAGTYAGALNNTPALAAAGGTADATVGYSVAYLGGLIIPIAAIMVVLRGREHDRDSPTSLVNESVRVVRGGMTVGELVATYSDLLRVSRIRRTEHGPLEVPTDDVVLEEGNVISIVGSKDVATEVAKELGHASSHQLPLDRRYLDMRRITVSDSTIAGRTIGSLRLDERFDALAVRLRRGDTDIIASRRTVLQQGDRVRVVAPRGKMKEVTDFFGDSARGLSELNAATLGIGLTLGILLGLIPIPLPGGNSIQIGMAAGTLLVGLVAGRLGRIGPVITSLPYTAATVLSDIGILIFLAYAGTRAGSQIINAFTSGNWLSILILGLAISLWVAVLTAMVMRTVFKVGRTRVAGMLGGAHTQPALLAFANERTDFDQRVAVGYSLIYAAAMVTKILAAQILGGM